MRRQYRQASKLSSKRRARLVRVLSGPLFIRTLLPPFLVMGVFVIIGLGIARVIWPTLDTNGWPFIIAFLPLVFAVYFGTWAIAHALFIRWLLRYRTARHGRIVALGDILRPSDTNPSLRRRLVLCALGVSQADRATSVAPPQSGGIA